jgi:hypothetical protein
LPTRHDEVSRGQWMGVWKELDAKLAGVKDIIRE